MAESKSVVKRRGVQRQAALDEANVVHNVRKKALDELHQRYLLLQADYARVLDRLKEVQLHRDQWRGDALEIWCDYGTGKRSKRIPYRLPWETDDDS
jgi:hypothetical protein